MLRVLLFFCANLFLLSAVALGQSAADTLRLDVEAFRKNYESNLIRDKYSPITKYDLAFVQYFEPNIDFRVVCKSEKLQNQELINFSTTSKRKKKYRKFMKLNCTVRDTIVEFFAYESEHKNYIFIPFTDYTSGYSTYGGGRYIDLSRKELSGDNVIIDFNKSYNPYCAFGTGFSCPVPPVENSLKVHILAGEKKYSGVKKHEYAK